MQTDPLTFRQLLAEGRARLEAAEIETAALDAAVLLAHAAGVTRTTLYVRLPEDVGDQITEGYKSLILARTRGVAVAYLIGEKEFLGRAFAVTAATLVPRPETELLVLWAEDWLTEHSDARTAVDVGTGSGAIAVSLAARVPALLVIASDMSADALQVARRNAIRSGVQHRVPFVRGNLLAWLGAPVALVLANLPYLTDAQADDIGIAAEPRTALVGGDTDGFALYRRLIPQVARQLADGGAFVFEIDPAQEHIAYAVSEAAFPNARVVTHRDFATLPRFVTVERER